MQKGKHITTVRKVFWPIFGTEHKRVVPLCLMMLFGLFNTALLHDVKDALFVTAHGSGAESISFLKVYGSLPFIFLMTALYAKLSLYFTRAQLFYLSIGFMLSFFLLFAFVLFPNNETFNPSEAWIQGMQEYYPRLKWIIPIFGNWTVSLFYVFSEMWTTFAISILFWTFANQITQNEEARRFYPLFGMVGNVGLIISGTLLKHLTSLNPDLPTHARWEINLQWIAFVVFLAGLCIMALHGWVIKNGLTHEKLQQPRSHLKSKKPKLGLIESFRVISRSKYIGFILILVLGYSISLNLFEITWKAQIKVQFPDANDYAYFMGNFSFTMGIVTIILMFVGNNILRIFSWLTGALTTPFILYITGAVFLIFVYFKDQLTFVPTMIGVSPMMMAVWVGFIHSVMSKASKYSLFDSTKEMVYIPLNQNLKIRGKAAVDGVGNRLGKSGGAIIQQVLLVSIVGSTQISLSPYIFAIVTVVVLAWIFAVFGLNREYKKLVTEREPEDAKKEAA